MKECGRCGDDYKGYMFLVPDDFSAIVRMQMVEEVFGQVCEDCRSEIEDDELYSEWEDPRSEETQ